METGAYDPGVWLKIRSRAQPLGEKLCKPGFLVYFCTPF
jgi:hypothetical protein